MYSRKAVGSLAIKLKMVMMPPNMNHPPQYLAATLSPTLLIHRMSCAMESTLTMRAIRVGSTSSGLVMLIKRQMKNTRLTNEEL